MANALDFSGVTSGTTLTMSLGLQSFIVNKVGAFTVGQRVRIIRNSFIFMEGTIFSINGNIIGVSIDFLRGGGTYNTWTFALTGELGTRGISGTQGLRGFQGSVGLRGSVGPAGPRGFLGSTGPAGFTGSRGTTGFAGSIGAQGPAGPAGGYAGSIGEKGFTGSKGDPDGYAGSKGDTGFTGSRGERGEAGFEGPRGLQGLQGNPGFTGSQGATGNTGVRGEKGDKGDQGLPGAQGIPGQLGPQGIQGIQGNVGFTGSRGEAGAFAAVGFAGSVGATGNVGFTGSAGTGISSANVTAEGVFSLTYTDASTTNLGSILGPTGNVGYTGSQGNVGFTGSAGLGISSSAVTAGNLILTYSDSTVVNLGNVTGPQGIQGPQGQPGLLTGGNANVGNLLVNSFTTFSSMFETIQFISGATGVVNHDFSKGAVFFHQNVAGVFTINLTNFPTTRANSATVVTVLYQQGAVARISGALQVNGTPVTVRYINGITPAGKSNKIDMQTFTIIKANVADPIGSWIFLGQVYSFG